MTHSHSPHPHLPHPSLKHPGRWFWLLVAIPIVIGLTRLRFDVEVFDLLPTNLKVVDGLKAYQQYFANARELIITVQAPSAEQAEAAVRSLAEHLRQYTNLVTGVTWEPPGQEHPEQLPEFLAYLWFNQPPAVFGQLTNRLAPERLAATLETTREELATSLSPEEIARLSYDPYGLTRLPENVAGAAPSFGPSQNGFASSDGTFHIVFVEARPTLHGYHECEDWLTQIREIANRAVHSQAQTNGVTLGYTGRPAFVAEAASGMQRDITKSVGGTSVIIAILFWLAHRRIKPMLWLLTLLGLVLGSTLALGGLIYGRINVVSMGFAAILLGLAVDYAVVHYQEALAHPNLTIPQIRHAIAPSIFWAALTTITAFLVLNFGGLPGLGQLGTMVGLGVALAATIMIFEFLPPLFPGRNEPHAAAPGSDQAAPSPAPPESDPSRSGTPEASPTQRPFRFRRLVVFPFTALLLLFTIVVLAFGLPPVDTTANALRPRNSPAYDTLDQIQAQLNQQRQPLWLIVGGSTVTNVAERLAAAQSVLSQAVSNHLIGSFTLPVPLWPRPAFQAANRAIAHHLAAEGGLLRQVAETNGFTPAALGLTDRMLNGWQAAGESTGVFWPTNQMSRWVFAKFAARTPTNAFALGLVNAVTNVSPATMLARLTTLESELPQQQTWLSGWEMLGHAIFLRVQDNMWKVVAPMIVLVLLSLYLAFRRRREILLSLSVLLLSGLCVLTAMRLAGWSWNLLDLMAIPLVLGTGVDYSLFMQLALRRYHGDLLMAYRSVGRALLLCGGTAMAGFGSLAWSSNAGMASLGRVCAVGIGSNMFVAIFLLPVWWDTVKGLRPRRPVVPEA